MDYDKLQALLDKLIIENPDDWKAFVDNMISAQNTDNKFLSGLDEALADHDWLIEPLDNGVNFVINEGDKELVAGRNFEGGIL